MTTSTDPFADFAASAVKESDPSSCPLTLQMMTFFGRSGTGKTSVAANLTADHIYLDLEASATEQKVKLWPWGKTWAKFAELIELTFRNPGGPLEGKTLVIDPVSELWFMCYRHVLAQQTPPRTIEDYSPGEDYAALLIKARNEFGRIMQMLLRLRMDQRMGTVFIAHEVVVEEVTPSARTVRYEPKAGDKWVSAWISEKVQMILRFSIEDADPLTGQVWTDKHGQPAPGPRWVIRTKPLNGSDVVKDRTLRLPPFVLARADKLLAAYG